MAAGKIRVVAGRRVFAGLRNVSDAELAQFDHAFGALEACDFSVSQASEERM